MICSYLYLKKITKIFPIQDWVNDACYNYRWKLKCSTKVRSLRREDSQRPQTLPQKPKQVDKIVRFVFSYRNSGFFITKNTDRDVCFAYKEEQINTFTAKGSSFDE